MTPAQIQEGVDFKENHWQPLMQETVTGKMVSSAGGCRTRGYWNFSDMIALMSGILMESIDICGVAETERRFAKGGPYFSRPTL